MSQSTYILIGRAIVVPQLMRRDQHRAGVFLSSFFILSGVLLAPHLAHAGATFTTATTTPYVSSIAVKIDNEFVSPTTKTRSNVTVVVSIESLGKSYSVDTPLSSDSYTFTDNGSFEFTFHDVDGNTGSSIITIDNIDRTPPEITFESYATTSTNVDITVNAHTNEGTLATSTYTFTDNGSYDFVATDDVGNVATSTVTITNIDRTAPVITLVGAASTEIKASTPYVDEGATATDDVDGRVAVVTTGTVDVGVPGTYTLSYDAVDAAGNSAATVTRTVDVVRHGSSGGGGGGGGGSTSSSSSSRSAVAQVSGGEVLGASTYHFASDLKQGDNGDDVQALQEMLVQGGFLTVTPTGYYGSLTVEAVQAFQRARGILSTGYVGPLTITALNAGIAPVSPPTTTALYELLSSLLAQVLVLQQKLALIQA